jgi:folate-dependent phosphoribosylglycinamide formyltransferase PurN
VTFVPENYSQLVCGLADSPHIVGCMVIDNREWKMIAQGLALLLTGAAPRMGWQLLKNLLADALHLKQQSYQKAQKKFFIVSDLNSEEALTILRDEKIDLILNARTRTIFKKKLLETPKLGCINIHHGLLPDQRGLMCDFWAHLEKTPAGFSIHQMTPKLDDGAILKVVEVPSTKDNYLESILEGSRHEVWAAHEALGEIAKNGRVQGLENKKTETTIYRRNPTITDFFKLRFKGVKI